MDYLTRASIEHGRIYESLAVFRQALEITQGGHYHDLDKLEHFFSDLIIPHFQYEEEKLFPIMSERGTPEEKNLTRELIHEHGAMLKDIDGIRHAAAAGPADGPALTDMVKAFIKNMLEHSRKEDRSFYPNLKQYLLNQ